MVLEQRALWNQHHWLQVVQQCVRGHEASGGDIRVQPIAIASGRSEISMEFFQSALPSACRRDWLYSFDLKDVYLQVLVSSFVASPFVCLMRRFFPFGGCFGFSSAPMVHLFDSWPALQAQGVCWLCHLEEWVPLLFQRDMRLRGYMILLFALVSHD